MAQAALGWKKHVSDTQCCCTHCHTRNAVQGSEWVQVTGLQQQTKLSDLWLNDNPVRNLEHLQEALTPCKDTLQVVYLENSPAAKSTTAYLHIMRQMLPKLEQLDSTPIQRGPANVTQQ